MVLLFGGGAPSPKRNIFVRTVDRLSRENLKKFFFAERVFKGQSEEIDVEELLLDTSGDVEFVTENFNPFGDREEDFDKSLRPVEAVETWNEIESIDKMRTPKSSYTGELSIYVIDDDLVYDMLFVHSKNHYIRGEMYGVLQEDVDEDEIETICNRYGIENTMDGWNRDFDDVESLDDYTNLADESYAVGIEQLQEGIMQGEIRDVRYLDSDYNDLSEEELMSILLSETMVPEKIEVSEHEKKDETLYDVRVWDYDTGQDSADLEMTIKAGDEMFKPADEEEIYDAALEEA